MHSPPVYQSIATSSLSVSPVISESLSSSLSTGSAVGRVSSFPDPPNTFLHKSTEMIVWTQTVRHEHDVSTCSCNVTRRNQQQQEHDQDTYFISESMNLIFRSGTSGNYKHYTSTKLTAGASQSIRTRHKLWITICNSIS